MTLTDENLHIRYTYSINGECKSAEIPRFKPGEVKCGVCMAEMFLELPCTISSTAEDKTVIIHPSECSEAVTHQFSDAKPLITACRSCIQRKFTDVELNCVKIKEGSPFVRIRMKLGYFKTRCRYLRSHYHIEFPLEEYQKHQKDINLFIRRMETEAKGLNLSTEEARRKAIEYIEQEKRMLLHFFKSTEA